MRSILTWAVCAAAAFPAIGGAASLTRHPWLSLMTQTSVRIAWQTDAAVPGKVLYGESPAQWTEAAHPGSALDHYVDLTGLTPGARYFYNVLAGTDTLGDGSDWFRAAPADEDADQPYRFVVFGDLGRLTPAQRTLAARIDTLNADFALLAGDIIYEQGEPWNFTPQYFDVYRKTMRRTPFYPALGNHDRYYDNGASYLAAYHLPSNNPASSERYYSFDYGNAHVVALDVTYDDLAPDAAQIAWLDADLAATTKRWKFIFFHVPMYSNAGTHGDAPIIAAALGPIFDARGVDVVFQGHNHYYTRTYPIESGAVVDAAQEPDYVNPGGPIYIVTGGAGRGLYQVVTPWSAREAMSVSRHHIVSVDVEGPSLELDAIGLDGTVFDSMTLTKTTPTAVAISSFTAEAHPQGVRLRWTIPGASPAGPYVHVERADASGTRRLTPEPLAGGPDFELLDRDVEPGHRYSYRLLLVEDGVERPTGWITGTAGAPPRFSIGRPRPTPAAGAAEIPFATDGARIDARIVDLSGRLVRTLAVPAGGSGEGLLRWDGRDDRGIPARSGIYFAVLRSGDREERARLVLLR